MHPLYLILKLTQAQLTPSEPNRVFALFDIATHCMARLDHGSNVKLTTEDKSQIVALMRPLAAAHNLTFDFSDDPYIIFSDCDLRRDNPSEVFVNFCGDQSLPTFHGTLHFSYLNHLFNSSQIKNILEQSTSRRCGADSAQVMTYAIAAGFFVLLMLCIAGAGSKWVKQKRNVNTSILHPAPIAQQPFPNYKATTNAVTLRKPLVYDEDEAGPSSASRVTPTNTR